MDDSAIPGGDSPTSGAGRPIVVAPIQEVVRFARTLHRWQQHVVECLLADGAVSGKDVEVAMNLLRADHGLVDEDPPNVRVLRAASSTNVDRPQIVLQGVGPVVDVNRLAPDQVLPFATDGLTVIYGENASGKSGFVRVLKAITSVPGSKGRLLPDVLTRSSGATPGGRVKFRSGLDDIEVDWRLGDGPIEDLRGIYTFDSTVAPTLAGEERVVEFLPAGLHALGELADVMVVLASRLDEEAAEIRRATPAVAIEPPMTKSARLVGRLLEGSALPTLKEIKKEGTWSTKNEAVLTRTRGQLAADPDRAAARIDRLATAFENMGSRLRSTEAVLGDGALVKLAQLRIDAAAARTASNDVGAVLSRDVSLLPSVGTDPWRQMFLFARDYAHLAYGSPALPPEPPGSRCPLCQQVLSHDSRTRMQHFVEYIEGQAEALAVGLEAEAATLLDVAVGQAIPTRQDVEAVAAAVESFLPTAVADLDVAAQAFELAQRRQDDLASPEALATASWPEGVADRVESRAVELRSLAASQRELADPEKRARLQADHDELVARLALSQQLPAARKRLELLGRLHQLSVARRACDTTAVSRKNSELRRAFLTADFEGRLREEFAALGLAHLPLKSTSRSQAGRSVVSVALDTSWAVHNADVLSDGEMRALALACFFADAQRIPGNPPIILDDPVSSLDHQRVERVAQRVVAEARKGRQVIIFTHSLVFFHELWMRASEARVPTSTHWLTTVLSVPGHVQASQRPWEVQDVKPRLNELERRLAQVKRISDHSSDDYRAAVSHFYTGLRETWERLVEEQLLGGVVERFRLAVETRRLSVVEVTSDDYAKVYFAMSRASEFSGHDRPVARQLAAPTPEDIARDLQEIRQYARSIRSRHEVTERERRSRHEPPPGQLEMGA